MIALILGILFILVGVYLCVPVDVSPLFLAGWGEQVLNFLMGGVPFLLWFIGLIAFFVGIADIKDKIEAKREEKEAEESE